MVTVPQTERVKARAIALPLFFMSMTINFLSGVATAMGAVTVGTDRATEPAMAVTVRGMALVMDQAIASIPDPFKPV